MAEISSWLVQDHVASQTKHVFLYFKNIGLYNHWEIDWLKTSRLPPPKRKKDCMNLALFSKYLLSCSYIQVNTNAYNL